MPDNEITLNITRFKAECLDLFKRIEQGKLRRVTVTRRGRPVAEVSPKRPAKRFDEIFGCMQGTITVPAGTDLIEAVAAPEEWELLREASAKDSP
jgi:antitoxin (DNA-binding transcriptional repressor) of toxin-antitoxin stability system